MLTKLYLALLATLALGAPAADPLDVEERSSRPWEMYIHPKGAPHMCLSAAQVQQGQYQGGRIYIKQCEGLESQRWLVDYGDTVLKSHAKSAQGNTQKYCLATGITNDRVWDRTNGKIAHLDTCPPHNKDTARPTGDTSKATLGVWINLDNGQIKMKNTNVCLDVKDGVFTGIVPVQQWKCHKKGHPDYLNQQWWVDTEAFARQEWTP